MLLKPPHSVLMAMKPSAPRAAPSLGMFATRSRYAPFVPVPKIAPQTHPPAVYARESIAPTVLGTLATAGYAARMSASVMLSEMTARMRPL